jgi:hypothetical protein
MTFPVLNLDEIEQRAKLGAYYAEYSTDDCSCHSRIGELSTDILALVAEVRQRRDTEEHLGDILNQLWGLLYPNSPASWEYPGQVLNHIRVELERLHKACEAVRMVVEHWRSTTAHWQSHRVVDDVAKALGL